MILTANETTVKRFTVTKATVKGFYGKTAIRMSRIERYINRLDTFRFREMLLRILSKQNTHGFSHTLNFVLDAARMYGKEMKTSLDPLDKHFGITTYYYKGFYFNWAGHDGYAVLSIFSQSNKLIFRR